MTVTREDRQLLDFLARFSYTTTAQLARLQNLPPRTVQRRLTALRHDGLVRAHRTAVGAPAIILPTRPGIAAAGLALPAPALAPGMLRHTLAVADLAVTYLRLGHRVVAEREIHADHARRDTAAARYLVHTLTARPYIPDLVLDPAQMTALTAPGETFTDCAGRTLPALDDTGTPTGRAMTWAQLYPRPRGPRPTAVEVELTRKRPDAYKRLLAAYRAADHLAGVIYFTADPATAAAIDRAAAEVGLGGDRLRLALYVPWSAYPAPERA